MSIKIMNRDGHDVVRIFLILSRQSWDIIMEILVQNPFGLWL